MCCLGCVVYGFGELPDVCEGGGEGDCHCAAVEVDFVEGHFGGGGLVDGWFDGFGDYS